MSLHWGPHLFLWPLTIPHAQWHPLVGPPSVLYIYNEIQIHISRTVSTPRATVWILLTLISWIMLIFTLSAHRQQTPHDMVVVTAVSVCLRVRLYVCVWRDCHVVKLICMWKGGLITSLMQMSNAHMHTHTYIHTTDSLLLRSKRQCKLSFLRVALPPVRNRLDTMHRSHNGCFHTLFQIN